MDLRTLFFLALITALGGIGFLLVSPFLAYVLAAMLLAFVLHPAKVRLEARIGSRPAAAALTALATVVAVVPLVVFSVVLVQSALTFAAELDRATVLEYVESARTVLVEDLGVPAGYVDEAEALLVAELDGILASAGDIAIAQAISIVDTTIHMGLGAMLMLFLVYYFLADGTRLLAWIRQVVPVESAVVDELFDEVSVVTWAVVKSHLLVAVVQGLLGGVGFWIVGIPNAPFWTLVMIIASVLPIVGVWTVWGPAVVYLAALGDVPGTVFMAVYGLALLSVVDNYVRALFVDRGSGLHPAVVLVGVLGGLYLLGVLGIFLGPILLAVFKATVTVFSRTHDPAAG